VVLPAWLALIVQVPVVRNVAVVPDTVHTAVVAETKVTVKPELAVAERVSGVPTLCAAIEPKLIVCVAFPTAKLCALPVTAA
jgi:hypothetical protein